MRRVASWSSNFYYNDYEFAFNYLYSFAILPAVSEVLFAILPAVSEVLFAILPAVSEVLFAILPAVSEVLFAYPLRLFA
jgi:hypothetical protein